MLPAFWFCMMMVYLYIRGVNDLGICNSILPGFVEEEADELTDCFWLRRRLHILISGSFIRRQGVSCSVLALRWEV